jgi:hypothetical protein
VLLSMIIKARGGEGRAGDSLTGTVALQDVSDHHGDMMMTGGRVLDGVAERETAG